MNLKRVSFPKRLAICCLVLCLFDTSVVAQFTFPSLSPPGSICQVVGNTTIGIKYERPSVRGREIFGSLVPWEQVWRTGAGHCSKISFDQPVRINGDLIAAGTYAVFSIPGEDNWTMILNSDTTLYGSYDYDSDLDIARFDVTPTSSSRFYETFTFDIDIIPNNAIIFLSWANTQVSFEIETTTDAEIMKYIDEYLLQDSIAQSDPYAFASEYLQYQNKEIPTALTLAQKAILRNSKNEWAWRLKMELQELLDQKEAALKTAIEAQELFLNESVWSQQIERIKEKVDN